MPQINRSSHGHGFIYPGWQRQMGQASTTGVAVNAAGELFVVDTLDNTLRRGIAGLFLQSDRSPHGVILSWLAQPGVVIESIASLQNAASWNQITQEVYNADGQYFLTNRATGAEVYYRLRKP